MFWSECGCSEVGGECSGVFVDVLEWVRVFWNRFGCSGESAGVLNWVLLNDCECILK